MTRADGKDRDIRASDAERNAVASDLGQHFQDGRLDQAEFDERLTAAMDAKTWRDLGELLTDLPESPAGVVGWASSEPGHASASSAATWRLAPLWPVREGRRGIGLLPLLVAAVLIGGMLTDGWPWPFAPLGFVWLIVPVLVARAWLCGGRRLPWR